MVQVPSMLSEEAAPPLGAAVLAGAIAGGSGGGHRGGGAGADGLELNFGGGSAWMKWM